MSIAPLFQRLIRYRRSLGVSIGLLLAGCHTTTPSIPSDVIAESRWVKLTDKLVIVDSYQPKDVEHAPVVVVAHGFTRSKRYMAGWGILLAKNGFTALVLNQPTWADHTRNGKAIAELLLKAGSNEMPLQTKPDGRTALVGMSMGGLTSLLACEQSKANAWVGLDPVDTPGGVGAKVARHLNIPAAVLLAEPSRWNFQGNARGMIDAFPDPPFVIKVRDAAHCDTESPTDIAGKFITGWTSPKRLETYEQYVLAFLKAKLLDDEKARNELDTAKKDEYVTVIEHATTK